VKNVDNEGNENGVKVRDANEIQKTHDLLVALILGEVEYPSMILDDPAMKQNIRICADVLCWVLCHEHNKAFENNLKVIRTELAQMGYYERMIIKFVKETLENGIQDGGLA
jgi:NADH:ubiquinone oxidoreductase subunit E